MENLWSRALDEFAEAGGDQSLFDCDLDNEDDVQDLIQKNLLPQVEKKDRASSVLYKRKGKPVTVRHALEKIVQWLDNFKKIGDVIVQYDPAHAALPWAAFRFILQAAVNEQTFKCFVMESLVDVSELITRFAWVETLYLHASSTLRAELQRAIVKLYTPILEFLSHVKKHYSKQAYQKVLKAIVSLDNLKIEGQIKKIRSEEEKVLKIAHLIDTQYQQGQTKVMEGGFSSVLARIDGLSLQLSKLNQGPLGEQDVPDQKRDEFLQWLAATSTHQDFLNALEARESGTCGWITRCPAVQEWLTAEVTLTVPRLLWSWGHPGAGKSVLSAHLAEYLQQDCSNTVASFFCYYGHEKKSQYLSIIRSWISQAMKFCTSAWSAVSGVFQEKATNFAEPFELWRMFRQICKQIRGCIFVVDGFDECSQENDLFRRHSSLDAKQNFLKNLDDAIRDTDVRVFIMSRFDSDLKEYVENNCASSGSSSIIKSQYEITKTDTAEDLARFTESRTNLRLAGRDPDLIKQLIEDSVKKANGMFLWITLAHNRLSRAESPSNLRNIIENQPVGLDLAYERDMKNILELESERRNRAIEILRLTLYAHRPLTLQQLLEVLLVDLDHLPRTTVYEDASTGSESDFDVRSDTSSNGDSAVTSSSFESEDEGDFFPRNRLPFVLDRSYAENDVLKLCGSFVELRQADDSSDIRHHTVHFVHFSMCEYLQQTSIIKFPELEQHRLPDPTFSHDRIVQLCLRYLCYDDFIQKKNCSLSEFDEKVERYPFLRYAGVYWGGHMKKCRPLSASVVQLCNTLLDPVNSKWLSYSEVVGGNANGSYRQFITRFRNCYPNPLFYASLWGVLETMHFLMDKGEDVNHVGGLYGNPLNAAAAHGDTDAVKLLLEKGAYIDAVGGMHGTALTGACYRGESPVVTHLIQNGADVNKNGGWYSLTPIVAASQCDSRKTFEDITRQLVKAGANVNSADNDQDTALHYAAISGKLNVVKYLIRHGAKLDPKDNDGSTPLIAAIGNGRRSIALCLVKAGADINIGNADGYTAVHLAAENGHADLLRTMLDHKPDFDARAEEEGPTPLDLARESGHNNIVEFLEGLRSGS